MITSSHQSQVIWISGFSASGKTSVGRQLEALFAKRSERAIVLDGDELRSIFAQRWGYSRDERVELARVYFRLCNLLASQGATVVISAVAMYDEVRQWLKAHVPSSIEVYLEVPEKERRSRDQRTKNVYGDVGSLADMYDLPKTPDLVVENYGEVTPASAAAQILEFVDERAKGKDPNSERDHGRSRHWSSFYSAASAPGQPTTFASAVERELKPSSRILEVGCGNGRDAVFFARCGLQVVAVDRSPEAIDLCTRLHGVSQNLGFFSGELTELPECDPFDAAYSRFVLHAMTPTEEDRFLSDVWSRLQPSGALHIECRSINDPLARQGEVLSRTERMSGHYRRFIVPAELEAKLSESGFVVDRCDEREGVAKFGNDDPVVIRALARKPS